MILLVDPGDIYTHPPVFHKLRDQIPTCFRFHHLMKLQNVRARGGSNPDLWRHRLHLLEQVDFLPKGLAIGKGNFVLVDDLGRIDLIRDSMASFAHDRVRPGPDRALGVHLIMREEFLLGEGHRGGESASY